MKKKPTNLTLSETCKDQLNVLKSQLSEVSISATVETITEQAAQIERIREHSGLVTMALKLASLTPEDATPEYIFALEEALTNAPSLPDSKKIEYAEYIQTLSCGDEPFNSDNEFILWQRWCNKHKLDGWGESSIEDAP